MHNPQTAITTLQRLLQLVPTHTVALYRLANLLYRSDEYSEALDVARTLMGIQPGYRDGASLLATIQNKIRSTRLTVNEKEIKRSRNSL